MSSFGPNDVNLSDSVSDALATAYLSQFSWPIPLQMNFLQSVRESPARFVILDNSGSMSTADSRRVIAEGHKRTIVPTTRWVELYDFVKFHAGFAEAAQAPVEFRLLNGSQPITIGRSREEDGNNFRRLMELMDRSPSGGTPLCRHVREVIQHIQSRYKRRKFAYS
jgi:hypothetical protein